MVDYMNYFKEAKKASQILDGSNNMQSAPLKGTSITKGAGLNGPVDIATGAVNQQPGILNQLASPSGAVALGRIAQALDPEGVGGRLGAAGEQGGLSTLFQEGLQGGKVSNLLAPEQQAAIQDRKDREEQRQFERRQATVKEARDFVKLVADLENSALTREQTKLAIEKYGKELGLFDERAHRERALFNMQEKEFEMKEDMFGLEKQYTNAQIQNLQSLTRSRNLQNRLLREGGITENEEVDPKIFGAMILEKFPDLRDISQEVISGKTTPEEAISKAFYDLPPDEYSALLNEYQKVKFSLGGAVPGINTGAAASSAPQATSPQQERTDVSLDEIPPGLEAVQRPNGDWTLFDDNNERYDLSGVEYQEYLRNSAVKASKKGIDNSRSIKRSKDEASKLQRQREKDIIQRSLGE